MYPGVWAVKATGVSVNFLEGVMIGTYPSGGFITYTNVIIIFKKSRLAANKVKARILKCSICSF